MIGDSFWFKKLMAAPIAIKFPEYDFESSEANTSCFGVPIAIHIKSGENSFIMVDAKSICDWILFVKGGSCTVRNL